MVRTQIQLTEEQASILRALSAARGVSMAELIRMSVDTFLRREAGPDRDAVIARAKAAAGRFYSGSSDTSAEHDRYLTEALHQR